MFVPIIVLQSNIFAEEAIYEALVRTGLKPYRDFLVSSGRPMSEEVIANWEAKQLLVTGTLNGNEDPIIEFVRRMKEKNKQLEVWFFSTVPPLSPSVYDRVIKHSSQRAEFQNLATEAKKFWFGR
jgi:hypothetical protein